MAGRVCPVWVGYLLASPLRRLLQNPQKTLGKYVKPGMKVLDIGCAMGFFSLAMARMVESEGKVFCVDLQEKMIESLKKRATKAGLLDRISPRVCSDSSLEINDLAGQIDFALAFYVVHEVSDIPGFMTQIHKVLKPGGKLFVAEPRGHTTDDEYLQTETIAQEAGFSIIDHPKIRKDRTTLFVKK